MSHLESEIDELISQLFRKHASTQRWVFFLGQKQRRSQNAEKVRHIKGRLLDQAMILFNCVLFQMGTSPKGKNLLREGANHFLYEQ